MRSERVRFIACFRRSGIVALLGVFLVLCASTLALADGLFDLQSQAAAAHTVLAQDDHASADAACPVCPDSHHSADHSCGCSHFHTSPVQAFVLNHSLLLSISEFAEPFRHLPDVYLERFIPPQIPA